MTDQEINHAIKILEAVRDGKKVNTDVNALGNINEAIIFINSHKVEPEPTFEDGEAVWCSDDKKYWLAEVYKDKEYVNKKYGHTVYYNDGSSTLNYKYCKKWDK